ncbi:GDSL esterase/lipase At1g73610-like [Euphorbia lathyris]|uniref:GDSL esterase/lipase At1g73610-like n=1 Tax=Euphorbia lathyris TaxID=212925 RepID=UPI0033138370
MEFSSNFLRIVSMVIMFMLPCRIKAAGNISAVLAFGDSILDTGNNNLLLTASKCNFAPYGMSLPTKTPSGRFGNGRVFSDVLSEKLGLKSMIPAYLSPSLKATDLATGVCFASGGSGLDDLTANVQGVITMGKQLSNFKEYVTKLTAAVGAAEAKTVISNALFLISSGNNDLGITYTFRLRPTYTLHAYVDKLMPLAEDLVKQLYALGARKIGYMGVLPLGCLPGNRATVGEIFCNEFLNSGSQYFNSKLQTVLTKVGKTLTDADVFYIDVYNPLLDVINNFMTQGFTNPGIGCCCIGIAPCPKVETHVFWDVAHPTEKTYKIMMETIVPKYAAHFSS